MLYQGELISTYFLFGFLELQMIGISFLENLELALDASKARLTDLVCTLFSLIIHI